MKLRVLTLIAVVGLTESPRAQVRDPVPNRITSSGILVGIEDVLQAPRSTRNDPQGARARLNLLTHASDNSGRLFVNDMAGKLYVIADPKGTATMTTYLDFEAEFPQFHSTGWSDGFNSFAFHPAFADNGKLYTVHSEVAGARRPTFSNPRRIGPAYQSVVVEWTAQDPSANAFSGSQRELMRVDQPRTNHPIGQLGFNPNVPPSHPDFGQLYIASGDGGSMFAEAPENLQRLDSPLGTIMRIDPFGADSANGQYGIPADNPFLAQSEPQTLTEIWAYGFRNHHRFSWDTVGDQHMFISDIGEDNLEEINLGQAGANYGWPVREGTFMPDPLRRNRVLELPDDDETAGFTYPVAQYDHDEGVAITGGYVYRGAQLPDLDGLYLFGDIRNGRIFYFNADRVAPGEQSPISELEFVYQGKRTTLHQLMNSPSRVDLRFGHDQLAEIYLLTKRDGMIRKIVPLGLRISLSKGNKIELRWVRGELEMANAVSGLWTPTDQDSPFQIEPGQGTQFYRLRP